LLHEARLPWSILEAKKREMGTDAFNAQYLGAPVPETGNALRNDWLQWCDEEPIARSGDEIVKSWDTAMKAGDKNDYSVCLNFRICNKNQYYLIDVFRKRLEFQDLLKVVLPQAQKFQAGTVLIEEQASGIPFMQMAKSLGVQGVVGIKHRQADPDAECATKDRGWVVVPAQVRILVGGFSSGIPCISHRSPRRPDGCAFPIPQLVPQP
jgi:phage terminase large subunit-like protein